VADQLRQRPGELGGRLVAALLGQPRVTVQVQEAHRRHPLGPHEHPGGSSSPSMTSTRSSVHTGSCCRPLLVLDRGGQAQPLRPGTPDPAHPRPVRVSHGLRQLQQRHDLLELVLADRLVRCHAAEPHRLQARGEHLQRHPGLLADLPVGRRRPRRPAPVGAASTNASDSRPARMAAAIASSGRPARSHAWTRRTPFHVAGLERAGAVADEDAEVDQAQPLRHRGAGEVGECRCREPVHTVSTGMLPSSSLHAVHDPASQAWSGACAARGCSSWSRVTAQAQHLRGCGGSTACRSKVCSG
jgi:hypothetical protein